MVFIGIFCSNVPAECKMKQCFVHLETHVFFTLSGWLPSTCPFSTTERRWIVDRWFICTLCQVLNQLDRHLVTIHYLRMSCWHDRAFDMLQVDATQRMLLEELPPVLVLHLKWFTYDKNGGLQKCIKQVDFDIDLEIGKGWLSLCHCFSVALTVTFYAVSENWCTQ